MPGPSSGNATAVVFAYHNVGVRCLLTLLAHGVRVPLVVTHVDAPEETIWFDSVAATAAEHAIPVIAPDDPGAPDVVRRIAALRPDFIFSFYYRRMLKPALLALPSRGALNMHGSLLPCYRGRAPVNWAVLHGERMTGATLHYMAEKPDSGDIVAQTAVPILPDDTAREVFDKVTVAAQTTLDAVLPALLAGTAPRHPQDLRAGSYFGGREPGRRHHRLEQGRCGHPQSGARRRAAVPGRVHLGRRASRPRAAHARRRYDRRPDPRAIAFASRREHDRALRRRRPACDPGAGNRRPGGRRGAVRAALRSGAGRAGQRPLTLTRSRQAGGATYNPCSRGTRKAKKGCGPAFGPPMAGRRRAHNNRA